MGSLVIVFRSSKRVCLVGEGRGGGGRWGGVELFFSSVFVCCAVVVRRRECSLGNPIPPTPSFYPSFLLGSITGRSASVQEMPAYGIAPDVVSYNSAISACGYRARYGYKAATLKK